MTYKDRKENLLREGLIKECPIDFKAIISLVKRAHIDLKTAKRNLTADGECAYNYAYNAMLRSGLALMFNEGFRPEIKKKHQTVVRFASSILGEKFKKLVNDYDFMRRKRNRFIYDSRHSEKEQRYFCIGKVKNKVLTVRFTYREEKIRIYGAGYWRRGEIYYEKEKI